MQGRLRESGQRHKAGARDILCWSSWWMEKAGFWSECGRAFTSLLRIS